ncbi:MAG: barstar family protein [Candidatus Nanopelagicales bacterium]
MSALEKLSGVRRIGDATIEELEAEADDLGWRCVVLDGAEVEDRESFLQMCDEAFGLPDWFGMNWDALEECLIDLDLGEDEGVLVVWSSWGLLAEAEPPAFAIAVDILGSAVRSWASDGVAGGVMLLGEGPDVDVDTL